MPDVFFNGPDGRLEGRYNHGKARNAPIAVVLHPHPQHGGTMNNKITYTLFRAFAQAGFSVIRFNFRGVGRSEGFHDDGVGELSDAAAAMDWLQLHNQDRAGCWIAGFSFGAWIGAQALMRRPEVDGFIFVGPPANHYDFSFLEPCPCDGLIVQGDADDVVDPDAVTKLAERLNRKKHDVTYELMKGAGHFFENEMDDFQKLVENYIAEHTSRYNLIVEEG
jgi:alpha/beta superfamily hydrolase